MAKLHDIIDDDHSSWSQERKYSEIVLEGSRFESVDIDEIKPKGRERSEVSRRIRTYEGDLIIKQGEIGASLIIDTTVGLDRDDVSVWTVRESAREVDRRDSVGRAELEDMTYPSLSDKVIEECTRRDGDIGRFGRRLTLSEPIKESYRPRIGEGGHGLRTMGRSDLSEL